MTTPVGEFIGLAELLDGLLRTWNSDRSGMMPLVQLSQRTSSALCKLMVALRDAQTAGAVPVLLSEQTVRSMRKFVQTGPDTELYVLRARANTVLYGLEGDLGPLLKEKPNG